jgi:uncharacterized coiled-coil protein SlyX
VSVDQSAGGGHFSRQEESIEDKLHQVIEEKDAEIISLRSQIESLERSLLKRHEQCKELYEIVSALEQRAMEWPHRNGSEVATAGSQTEGPRVDEVVSEYEEVVTRYREDAERMAAGLSAISEKLKTQEQAGGKSGWDEVDRLKKNHVQYLSALRTILASEMAYSQPDPIAICGIIQDIEERLHELDPTSALQGRKTEML